MANDNITLDKSSVVISLQYVPCTLFLDLLLRSSTAAQASCGYQSRQHEEVSSLCCQGHSQVVFHL